MLNFLHQPTETPLSSEGSLAIGVGGFSVTRDVHQKHVALIYRDDFSAVSLIHLRWYKDFCHEAWNGQYYWVEFANLTVQVQETLADWVLLVAQKASNRQSLIPYSLLYSGDRSFDAEGLYINKNDGSGLTCSTFVMALFADYGIPLIDIEDWPIDRPEDVPWVAKILDALARKIVQHYPMDFPNFLKLCMHRHSLKRFRPEETLVTANLYIGRPLSFDEVSPLARAILPRLA